MTWAMHREAVSFRLSDIELEGEFHYDSVESSLYLVDPEPGEDEVLTVSLLRDGYFAFPGEISVRDYSEHFGLPAALVAAGICGEVEEISIGPFGSRVVRMRVIV
ncbi:hypothetical protein QP116_00015 [Pseudoglutamicibacter cumminsii]|uniref:Uncharacterized protein n=1 Tax=Pseudoglutamicibacter cumminsii TaxID=156979 RepID=A0AAP4FCY4_9MICC|nr:hypothetical protein [Pseudoglutamicibacter cumminsii]MDK6274151.1 hypothetical protein [Pseudoglutamicibacter cumminsii]